MRRSVLTRCGDTVLGRQHGHSIKQPLSSALTPPPFCAALLCPPRGTARDTRRHLVRRYRGNGLPEGGAGQVTCPAGRTRRSGADCGSQHTSRSGGAMLPLPGSDCRTAEVAASLVPPPPLP